MGKKSVKKRLLSLLTLALLLVPMFVLTTYAASSYQYSFDFSFNGTSGVKRAQGTKTDMSQKTASVTVSTAQLGAGNCTIYMENEKYARITGTRTVTGTGSYTLSYYEASLSPEGKYMDVSLTCYAQETVQALAGYFQP